MLSRKTYAMISSSSGRNLVNYSTLDTFKEQFCPGISDKLFNLRNLRQFSTGSRTQNLSVITRTTRTPSKHSTGIFFVSGGQLRPCRLQEGHRLEVRFPEAKGHRGYRRLERRLDKVFGHGEGFGREAKVCRQRRAVLAEVQL